MVEEVRCPECGTSLSPDAAPGQLCPRCLLSIALEPETDPDATPPPESSAGAESTELKPVESTRSGHIGPYRLLRKLGQGGMGEVYEAEQQEPVRRKVALKLIKWGMDTRRVVARFEAERQALALMNHPSIARVFDAGATEQGRPYFAMELVQGVPITDYCDRHRLSTQDRLELFMQVCEGVQHAHQKGIIHRDIKPSNVLVTIQNDKPVPKIIDFGVAKATEQRLTEKTVFTELGQLIGTLEYMSPEQAEMTGLDIDTRTDVYSLGVLLYQLLSGALPFEPVELRSAGYDEIRRWIREEEPAKPSTRLGSLGEAGTTAAHNRNTVPGALVRRLRGDLDWISMKALEKDRTRRYGSPADLAADVLRHLQSEPVVAGPPSAAYKMKKFVRRHRFGVAAASVVLVALVLGVVGTTLGMIRAVAAEEQAREEARRAEASNLFALGREILEDNPSGALAYATASIELADQPEVREFALRVLSRGPTAFVHEMPEFALSMEFSPDGHRLAAGGWQGIHQLWSQDGSTLIAPHWEHFSDDIRASLQVASFDGAPMTTHERDELVFVDFSDSGRFHVSSSDKNVRVWSLPDAREVRVLDIQPWWFEVRGEDLLTFTRVGESEDFSIQRWPLAGGEPETLAVWRRPDSLDDDLALVRFDVDPRGRWVAFADGRDLFVLPLDGIETESARRIGRGEKRITRVFFHTDGQRIATYESFDEASGVIRLWSLDGESSKPLRSFDAPFPVFRDRPAARNRTIRFDPGGRWMAAPEGFNSSTLVWDLSSPPGTEPLVLRKGTGPPTTMAAVHPAGTWLATADRTVSIWPVSRSYGQVLWRQKSPMTRVVFDPQGQWLAAASWEGTIRIWSLSPEGVDAGRVLYDSGRIWMVAMTVSPDGQNLAAALWDGRVMVVPVSGGPPRELTGFSTQCFAVAFDRTGRRVAAAGGLKLADDGVIRVWDLESGEVQVLDAGDGTQHGVHFTQNDSLISGGVTGLRLWDLRTATYEELVPGPAAVWLGPGESDERHIIWYAAERQHKESEQVRKVFVYDLEDRTSSDFDTHARECPDWKRPPAQAWPRPDGAIVVGSVTGEDPHLLFGHKGPSPWVEVHPNGNWIASAGNDGTLRLWPWPEGRPLQTLPYDELLARLRSLTNYRVAKDDSSITGYRLDIGPFPGWEELPTW